MKGDGSGTCARPEANEVFDHDPAFFEGHISYHPSDLNVLLLEVYNRGMKAGK
jgi:hypothetical protein